MRLRFTYNRAFLGNDLIKGRPKGKSNQGIRKILVKSIPTATPATTPAGTPPATSPSVFAKVIRITKLAIIWTSIFQINKHNTINVLKTLLCLTRF